MNMKAEKTYKFKSLLFTERDIYQIMRSEWHEMCFNNVEFAFLVYKMIEIRINSIESDIKEFEESLDKNLRRLDRSVLVASEVEVKHDVEHVKCIENKIEALKTLLSTYKKLRRLLSWLER